MTAPLRRTLAELAGWFGFALLLTGPAWLRGDLLGHPEVDGWNHAWGLWWWADSLAHGQLPWRSDLLAHPGGGTLWFADPLGALTALPVTLLAGPAVAWNLLLTLRIAWAGFHARRFAATLGEPGPHTLLAGVAFATSPYLLGELQNGISEVCATGWVPLVLTQWLVAVRAPTRRSWLLAGVALGGAWAATPYYGLALTLLLGPATLWRLRGAVAWRAALPGVALAGLLALVVIGVWRRALAAPDAVIQRDEADEPALARHNAVDLREPFWPGPFRSVDFEAEYGGEKFVHTVYLRWTVLALAFWAVARRPRAGLGWLGLAAAAVTLGLGDRLFYAGRYPLGDSGGLLPFGVLVRLVPGLAITHPARFAVAAHAVLAALAADALRGRGRLWVAAAPLVLVEGLFLSLPTWPIPSAPAAIPSVYTEIGASADPRGVLDLPAQVRRTMATSVYFWFQTQHHHPVPWWPNVRAEDNADPTTIRAFLPTVAAAGGRARFADLDEATRTRLRANYGWVVVHPALDRMTQGAGESTRILTAAFGPPAERDDLRVWTLPPPAR